MNSEKFFFKNKNVKVHFIGIGGIGMSGIAEVLVSLGYSVSGSDMAESATTKKLSGLGVKIYQGHKAVNVTDSTVVVYSSAVNLKTNPEILEAQKNGTPIMRRAEMLAELMRLKHGLAVAGTHGKTTTTSFLATILYESKIEPTYIIGGIVENLGGHAKVGKGNILVAEADESDGSFLLLNPIMSVITNIDMDHMDYYGTEEKLMAAFSQFANKVPFYGCTALNIHDKRLMKIRSEMKKPYITFGIKEENNDDGTSEEADYQAQNIEYSIFGTKYNLYHLGKLVTEINISLPGEHNVLNSLGAIALAHTMGLKFDDIANSIKKLQGIGRRFQLVYSDDNLEIVDDYAHHPTEVSKTLHALRETRPDSKIIAVFEPHRYSRTKECWNDFFHCFNESDELYLGPLYAASETPVPGITSERLVCDINKIHPGFAKVLNSLNDVCSLFKKDNNKKLTIMTLGAGSIGRVIRSVVAEQKSKGILK